MAIADVRTILSLDQYAEILGIDPILFNQMYTESVPANRGCKAVWFQYDWQDPNHASRSELAQAIAQAESLITNLIGYPPGPTWIEDEYLLYPSNKTSYDVYYTSRGRRYPGVRQNRFKTIQLRHGKFICGGRRRVELIEAGVDPGVTSATDRVSFTATYSGSETLLPSEVGVFYDTDTREERRIRGLQVRVNNTTGVITIEGWAPQFVDPDLLNLREEIDGDVLANYVNSVNIYRVYTSSDGEDYAPVEFHWQNTSSLGDTTTYGILERWNPIAGTVTPRPASWSEDDEEWSMQSFCSTVEPERVTLYYFAGHALDDYGRVRPPFGRCIAALATALLGKPICGCTQDERQAAWWQREPGDNDLVAYSQLQCPWGRKNGSWEAYEILRRQFMKVGGVNLST